MTSELNTTLNLVIKLNNYKKKLLVEQKELNKLHDIISDCNLCENQINELIICLKHINKIDNHNVMTLLLDIRSNFMNYQSYMTKLDGFIQKVNDQYNEIK